ncbi:cupin domain-containing protein [Salinimicrobium sp. HB62]|uniref:cupin domain-containing protein n=1 Tax=Salinimicrobium sp. HB62 TaxID=3077781 RepID=UPI002D79C18A|nr:cupin domain-containing protein [Salinimicrobium sp. HB62]
MDNLNKVWVLGHRVSPQKLSANYDLAIGESQPNVPGPPPHCHAKYHEAFHILEGEMDFIINGSRKTIKKGESVDLPPNTVHTFKNSGDKVCKWVNIHSPKGFSEFFEKYGVPESESNAAEKSVSPEIIQQVLKTASDYDMILK